MDSLYKYIDAYRKQMEKGDIVKAYRGLMDYIMGLRVYLANKYPDYTVSGSVYYGYMDMTYFAFTPAALRKRNLKIAVVFVHDKIRFEAWLAGGNRQVQNKYAKLFQESGWKKYPVSSIEKGVDSILETVVADNPEFDHLDLLTDCIESGTLRFIKDIGDFLDRCEKA